MTNSVRDSVVNSLPEFLERVREQKRAWKQDFPDTEPWFRGHRSASYRLIPGGLRRPWDEVSMFHRFCNQAPLLITLESRPTTQWQWYFAAQHYGLPTRLLDWSDDPLVGLYFALRGNRSDSEAITYDENEPPIVWMIDPGSLNKITVDDDCLIVPDDLGDLTRHYLPGTKTMPELPIAIQPVYLTARITAQSGTFTVHGSAPTTVEDLWAARAPPDRANHLHRLTIQRPDEVADHLIEIGYTRFRLFPEPASLADHLRHTFAPRDDGR